tara:strand:- start:407 stop:574 length:168 start_codon:yes stop_codon:yes gene_type:complete
MKTKTRNCNVSFCDNILDDFDDFCWGCYDRILENYNNKNTNPQWEGYKLQEVEEE